MKIMVGLIIGILAAVLVLGIVKDVIIKTAVEKGVERVTGLKLSMGNFRMGVLRTMVDIRDLKLDNPAGFKDRTMVDIPEIYVDYDLGAIMKGTIHLREARIDLKEFVVVKNGKGQFNLDSLKVVQAYKEGRKPEENRASSGGKTPRVKIDRLTLRIKKAIYKDYSFGGEPRVKEFNLNIDENFRNVDDPYAVVSIIVVKALANTTIADAIDFNLEGLQGTLGATLATVQKVTVQAVSTAQETATNSVSTVAETARQTGKAVKETAEALTDALKNPFGSDKK